MLAKFSRFLERVLNLNPDQRQNVTTFSMMAGEVSLLLAIGLLVYVLRYSWPDKILEANAGPLISGLFNVVYGLLGLMLVQTVGKVSIAIGGKLKATIMGNTVEADSDPTP